MIMKKSREPMSETMNSSAELPAGFAEREGISAHVTMNSSTELPVGFAERGRIPGHVTEKTEAVYES